MADGSSMQKNPTLTVKGRTRRYNPCPDANDQWHRDLLKAKLESLGIDPYVKSPRKVVEESLVRIDELKDKKQTANTEQSKVIDDQIEELQQVVSREVQTRKIRPKSTQTARTITEWSKKSRAKHLGLANEIGDMCEQGLMDPAKCLSITLTPDRRPASTPALAYGQSVKTQITRIAEYAGKLGAVLVGVIEPFPDAPDCPHFHALVYVPAGSLDDIVLKLKNRWRSWHPGHKRAVIKSLETAQDVRRVLVYPHKGTKKAVRDQMGDIGSRVVTAGLQGLPRLEEKHIDLDPLVNVSQYLQMAERRGITKIDWRPLRFFGCSDDLIRDRESALRYIIKNWPEHVCILGHSPSKTLEAWMITKVTLGRCRDDVVRVILHVFQGGAPLDVDADDTEEGTDDTTPSTLDADTGSILSQPPSITSSDRGEATPKASPPGPLMRYPEEGSLHQRSSTVRPGSSNHSCICRPAPTPTSS